MISRILFLLLISFSVHGQIDLKEKPNVVVMPFPPGGGTDATYISIKRYAEKQGIQLIPKYVPGADGKLSMISVDSSLPNGHTVLLTTVLSIATVRASDFNPDLTPISIIKNQNIAMVTNIKNKYSSFQEIVKATKQNETIFMGSGSPGQKMFINFLIDKLGPSLRLIPYKGTASVITDLVGNHIDLIGVPLSSINSHIVSEKVKLLGVMYATNEYPKSPILSKIFPDWKNYDGHILLISSRTNETIIKQWSEFLTKYVLDEEIRREIIDDRSIPVAIDNVGKKYADFLLLNAEQQIRAEINR